MKLNVYRNCKSNGQIQNHDPSRKRYLSVVRNEKKTNVCNGSHDFLFSCWVCFYFSTINLFKGFILRRTLQNVTFASFTKYILRRFSQPQGSISFIVRSTSVIIRKTSQMFLKITEKRLRWNIISPFSIKNLFYIGFNNDVFSEVLR